MIDYELLAHYEKRVTELKRILDKAPDHNQPELKHDFLRHVQDLRNVRFLLGLENCHGSRLCTRHPEIKCKAGLHSLCYQHVNSCYLCRSN
jgi:hypothetical protein